MKIRSLSFSLAAFILLISSRYDGLCQTHVSGYQSGYWDLAGSPYIVVGDIIVPENDALIIEAGVEVLFEDEHRILVDRSLLTAYGTEEDSIVFRPIPGTNHWGSIHILNTITGKSCLFRYCQFERANGAAENSRWGGAFYTQYGVINFENCRFLRNSAYTGAAIFGHLSTVNFTHCEIFRNSNDWKGGAINFNTVNVNLIYTAICHNSAVYEAGGIYAWLGNINVTNCTICNNSASEGGGIFNYPSTTYIDVINSIIYNNECGNISGPGYCSITFSNIGGGWPGTGNINENPMFINPGLDNYRLLPESPCIDAGDPNSPPDPDGTIADMGAYYYDQSGPGINLFLDVEPVNPPIIIPPQGGSFEYTLLITYDGPAYAVFDAWIEFLLPNGTVTDPCYIHPDIYLASADTIFRQLALQVSAWAMPGVYEFRGYLGDSPDSVYASDFFTFEKEAMYGAAPAGQTAYATLSGWDWSETIDLPCQSAAIIQDLHLTGAPNPFNPETTLRFSLPSAGIVSLKIYDVAGRAVATLLDREMDPGWHAVKFDGNYLPSGLYLAVLKSNQYQAVERLLLIK